MKSGARGSEFALTIAGGELGGTLTVGNPSVSCTEVWSVSGTRTNAAPSADFQGNWDFDITVTASGCEGEPIGSSEEICLSIAIDGNTVSIDDQDGIIAGIGDGNTVVLTRSDSNGSLEVTLTVSGNSITGTVTSFDIADQCSVTSSISGTKRTTPCPPPPAPGAFDGSWITVITVTSSDCFDEFPGSSEVNCMTVSVDGSNITLDDGSGDGLITGTIDGDTAFLSRTNANGTLNVSFEVSDDELFGSATMSFATGVCAELTVEYSIRGLRSSLACESGSGAAFEGFWNVTGEFISNGCEFTLTPDCSQFVQFGDIVIIDDGDLIGRVAGNTLTIHQMEGGEFLTLTVDMELQISGDGNSITGTQSITLGDPTNPANDCTSSASVSGTRTSGCTPAASGLSIIVPAGDRQDLR